MAVQFEIESVFKVATRGYFVAARLLTPGQDFFVTVKSTLGGVELAKYLDMPRSTNENGEQRPDLFAFQLKKDSDKDKLTPKTIVELIPGDTIHYLNPWHSESTDLTMQLQKEVNKDHILFGKTVKTLARRQDNDDVLFKIDEMDFQYAVVHLTWSQKYQIDSRYPTTTLYKNWLDVYENRIVVDHQGWEND